MVGPALPSFSLPDNLNYIAVFLTLRCHLDCSYCINDPKQGGSRSKLFKREKTSLTPEEWVTGLSRIPYREDLPVTLQGGEPMLYAGNTGVGQIMKHLPYYFDLLTAFPFDAGKFAEALLGQQSKMMRDAPYPSIRVSYHPEQMEKVWKGKGIEELVSRCTGLSEHGFRVSPVKSESDVGIYMVDHPENELTERIEEVCSGKIHFEKKEFLGEYKGALYGSYKYPYSTNLVSSGAWSETLSCECRTTELLLDPLGFAWGCHYHLYDAWLGDGPRNAYKILFEAGYDFDGCLEEMFADNAARPIGHILDPGFMLEGLAEFHACHDYGKCIGCDTKIKNNRFQSLDDRNSAHTSVEIRNIEFPDALRESMDIAV